MNEILITDETNSVDEFYFSLVEKVINSTLEHEGVTEPCEVSVLFVVNADIQKLNQEYRDINQPTDVLSFPLLENFDAISGELGDIVISVDKAKAQAEEYNHSLEREIAFLTAHSMLHLLGYDHMDKDTELEMQRRQTEILDKLGIKR